MSEETAPPKDTEEKGVKLDWVDTPKGKVPTLESTMEAFSEVANYLNELFEKIEERDMNAAYIQSQKMSSLIEEMAGLKKSIEAIRERLERLESMMEEVVTRESDILYLIDMIEKIYRRLGHSE
ncbi:MAG: hypothetical protein NZ920_00760 [Aigarchaeota archaeon]|nr:hypothetical protein [Aigarchaeota archaeon]MDW8092973.1 hypothetical protein [Nitrososphaerota archaeon]